MRIIILGERGEGKTTVSILVARFLKGLGFAVKYTGHHSNEVRSQIENPDEYDPVVFTKRTVTIVDLDDSE